MSPIVGGREQRAPPGEPVFARRALWLVRGIPANWTSGQARPRSRGLGAFVARCNHPAMAIRVAWVLAVAVVGLSWTLVGRTLANPSPAAQPTGTATAVVWGGLVFAGNRPLARWLHVHGVAYSVWSGRHPRAASTIKPAPSRRRHHRKNSTSG
jgi:hypothetical protein